MEVNFDGISIEEISEIFSRQLMLLPLGMKLVNKNNKGGKNGKRWDIFKKN